MKDIYEWVSVGLQKNLYDSNSDDWLDMSWNIYVLEFPDNMESDYREEGYFNLVVFATDKKSAIATAYDFLLNESDCFRLYYDFNAIDVNEIEFRDVIAQTIKINNPL